jgi:hypothetical protein
MMVFCRAHTVVHTIFCLEFCLVGVGLMWTWSRVDEFVLGLKSVAELCHSPPMGMGSADTSQPPMEGGDSHGQFTITSKYSNPARQ